MSDSYVYYLVAYFAVLISSTAQVLLKVGVQKKTYRFLGIEFNLYVLFGLGGLFAALLLSIKAMGVVPLKDMTLIVPASYVLVPLFSYLFLKEQFSNKKILGMGFIVIGSFVAYL
ncbi:EamA family transporter [Desulfovibrio sp. JC010]|uniref:EamA family transporter n=1 Tax=Desulfovibrio sp. JC010 TaxID=2593641 RepID=UPI001EF169F9|nr:EamA family transporter [Desulfovibrio sp. JC010]NDV27170.1 EamA family transporter [Desulfovibrio sp. JC010]